MNHLAQLLIQSLIFTQLSYSEQDGNEKSQKVKKEEELLMHKPLEGSYPYFEQFDKEANSRWTVSEFNKDGKREDVPTYNGEWKIEEAIKKKVSNGDFGLTIKSSARRHAISSTFKEPMDPNKKTFVAQYEVKLQNFLDCGGAYMKLLTYDPEFDPKNFYDKTPFTIMFGPDNCEMNNRVHFIFRHLNPITKEYEEKHLTPTPTAIIDDISILYTLVVRPNNDFEIFINQESVSTGNLLSNFTPSVNPPAEIEDSEDIKPQHWVEDKKIPDPDSRKPDDWDEDELIKANKLEITKPSNWLEDEPEMVPDPSIEKPAEWNDENDREWEAPQIPNPKCKSASGCGKWELSMTSNPNFMGKWKAPLIDNPKYIGEWKPKMIKNPNYFEDKTPSNFNKIGAIGFELWTIQENIMFDNIYIGYSEEEAKFIAEKTWHPKYIKERQLSKKDEPKIEKKTEEASSGFIENLTTYFNQIKEQLESFYHMARVDFFSAVRSVPAIFFTLLALFFGLCFIIFKMISTVTDARDNDGMLTPGKRTKSSVSDNKVESLSSDIKDINETTKKSSKNSKDSDDNQSD